MEAFFGFISVSSEHPARLTYNPRDQGWDSHEGGTHLAPIWRKVPKAPTLSPEERQRHAA
ncbi:hypothetical protein llg_41810 [Luteolibacter sp. LG18]|nr:hypothetical protein llg_41810 [Luteolibacter sp. LG18]